ncbi:unnamed protein product [Adineta steineri]|uniref:NAD(P)(+)--arginine ADP-ribosyltransferase n=1 Tax=Adineta steineri TaxID=433720 RepID=A0A819GFI7_9BILA|nr:unnamed protein product [Adineta steineri]
MSDTNIIGAATSVVAAVEKANDPFGPGDLFYWKCEYEKAKEYFQTVLNQPSTTLIESARCYNSLGATNAKSQNYEEALDNYHKQLDILLKLETSEKITSDIIKCYMSIGKVYCLKLDYVEAINYYNRALGLILTINSPSDLISNIYKDLANLYTKTQEFDLATEYFIKALEIDRRQLGEDHPKFGQTYANMGAMHCRQEDYKQALDYFLKAREIWQKSLTPRHIYVESMNKTIQKVQSKLNCMDEKHSLEKVQSSPIAATVSEASQPQQHIPQNYLLIWVDGNIDEGNKDCQDMLTQLQSVVNDVHTCTEPDQCIQLLNKIHKEQTFVITSGSLGQNLVPEIHDMPQLNSVYILCGNEPRHQEWTQSWIKIKGVYTNIKEICQVLQLIVKQCDQTSIALSFLTINEMASTDNLNQLEPTFMYTQLFKEILLDMEYGEQAIKQFTAYCRHNNFGSLINIDRFEKEYRPQLAIWWYTYPSFIYSMLNRALRTLDADIIISMGFFICHLHQQIQQLHQQQIKSYYGKPFIGYRGQGLSKANFEKLQKTKGGLLSFNNFLSTNTDKEISLEFARYASTELDKVGILFIMSIDPCVKSAPFASIKEVSSYQEEEEVLFSMHTVFRVNAIKQMDNDNQLYEVELQLTSDDDEQLRLLTDRIREETSGSTGWQRLGKLLLKIGQFNKAEELYNVLLQQTSDEGEKAVYYSQLGCVKYDQGDYEKAIWYHEKALEIQQKTLPSNRPHLATSYNNIGKVHDNMGEYLKALSYYEKALEISQETLPSRHPTLATSYNNIGNVYNNMGEYLKALSCYKKALEIDQKTLPSNHPTLATSYSNIGSVYHRMGEYSKALSCHEKALEISQKALPSNHPTLATSYSNIGNVYNNMGEYLKALSYYEKALDISQKALPSNHPTLATLYNNIGSVYNNMGEYSKALSYYERALEIQEKTLPSNHPTLATTYNNIGSVYDNMEEYSKALLFYEKALEISQETLPSRHPTLATSYNNIGYVYNNMGEYLKALSCYEKALEIREKNLPSHHPDLATTYNNIGSVYNNMGEYSKALLFYEKSLEILQQSLPSKHPHLATLYSNIGGVYDKMGEYLKALSFYEKALKIRQKTLPSNHPDLATSYSNIGSAFNNMGEYSKALSFYVRALEIRQQILPPNHSILATSYSNISSVYKHMGEYSKALSSHEKALEIRQTLPSKDSDLATSYINIGSVYYNMKDYSKALSYFERALDIWQREPSTHPLVTIVKISIEILKKDIVKNN